MPVFIVDPTGVLLFLNEPAEELLGVRLRGTGPMPYEAWSVAFKPTDRDGVPIAPDALPLSIALQQRRPAQSDLWIQGLDGERRTLSVTAIPLQGQSGDHLGAAAIFWEAEDAPQVED
jgi:PAS domain-containing protein